MSQTYSFPPMCPIYTEQTSSFPLLGHFVNVIDQQNISIQPLLSLTYGEKSYTIQLDQQFENDIDAELNAQYEVYQNNVTAHFSSVRLRSRSRNSTAKVSSVRLYRNSTEYVSSIRLRSRSKNSTAMQVSSVRLYRNSTAYASSVRLRSRSRNSTA